MEGGSAAKIEKITSGSLVEAFPEFGTEADQTSSPVTAELTQGKVVRTFNNVTDDWVEVHFTDPATGEAKTLTATPGHVMLTPEGGYKQLIHMIDAGTDEPELSGERTDVQSLGSFAGSVRLVLADSQIVTAQAWSIRYSEATAHLYEEAEMLVARTEGGLALEPEVRKGWKTYNFEVEEFHTYIAGGVRVHNMSEHVGLAYGYGGTYVDTPDAVRNGYEGQLDGDRYTYDHNGNIVYYDAKTDSTLFTHVASGVTYRENKSNTMLSLVDNNFQDGVDRGDGSSQAYEYNVGSWHFDQTHFNSPYNPDYEHSQVVLPGSPQPTTPNALSFDHPNYAGPGPNPGSSGGGSNSNSGSNSGGVPNSQNPAWQDPVTGYNPNITGGTGASAHDVFYDSVYGPNGTGWGGNNNNNNSNSDSGGGSDKPILLDLDDNGLDVTELDTSTTFLESIDDGLMRRTAWAGSGDGVLFFDEDGNNKISSTREYVFTEWDPTSARDLDALKSVFDTNNDGELTAADDDWASFKVAVTQADGSIVTKTLAELDITGMDLTGSATQIELPDGSVVTGTTEFTYGNGTIGTAGELILRADEMGYDVEQVESVATNGDRVQTTAAYAADGSIAFTIESTVAPDGSSTLNRYDRDGDGVVDQVQQITIIAVTNGTQKDEALYRGTDVASGILLEATRTTKVENATTRTETIERDSTGGGWYDQVEVRTTTLADNSLTITVTDKAQDGTAKAILTKTVSADGLTRTEELDVDADGAFEEKLVHAIAIDPVTGERTETTTRYNPDNSVRDVTAETVSADGQTRSVATDADGNAANETTVATAITVNVDGSTSSQFTITNEDGSVRSSQTHNQSDDALTKTIASDIDGDGTTDLTETDATVLALDGSRTQTVTQLNGDGSLRSARETWLAENRIETTTYVDADRSGTFDAGELIEDVTLNSTTNEVTATSYVRAVDGSVLAKEVRATSADGLTTQTSVDADGDGTNETVISDVTTVSSTDDSSTQVITTKNGDATTRSTVTQWVSADGLTTRIDTDSDGDGVLDQVDHVAQVNNVDGSTTTTTQTYAGDGTTLLASSTTDHSADRRTTTILTDANGDGVNDASTVRLEAVDGSVTVTETALNQDASVASSSTTTVSADGLTTTISDDMDGDGLADRVTRSTTTHNVDGSQNDTVRVENRDGTLRTEQVLSTSDDGHTTTLTEDEDGDGVIDRTVTTTLSYDADGTQRTVEVLTANNGAVQNRVQTLVSDDGLTTDVQLDADGDGIYDLTTRAVTTLQADGSTVELTETRDATNVLRNSTSVTTSDDGRTQTVATDLDGDGNIDRTETTVIADDGSVTTTRSATNPDGSLQSKTQSYTSGNGLISEERTDQDGDGTYERVEKSTTVLNADGSTTTTTDVTSADASKSYDEVITVSDDGRQTVTTTDVDGDGVVDFTTTDTITLAANGVVTNRSETRSRDATLIAVTETVTSADGDTITETMDWNGDGQNDAVTTTTVGVDGEVKATTITYAANGAVEGSHTVKTSDDGLTQTAQHDVAGDGQIELTMQDVSTLQANGDVLRIVTYTDQTGQTPAREEYLTSGDGLSSTIKMDLDGDGTNDLEEQIDFETKLDGSTERISSTNDGAAGLVARTVTTRSADGLTETVSTDLDGDGQTDRVDTKVTGADGGYVQTIQTFSSPGVLSSSRTNTVSADGRSEQRDHDLDGDGVLDQQFSRTLNADQSITTVYSDVDGATAETLISRTVEANGLDSMTSYDLDADGSAELIRNFTTDYAADGSEIMTLTHTAETGQKVYEEIRTVSADGLTATTTYDHDGDGIADTTKVETTVIHDDGSRTQTIRSTYADGSLHSETITDTDYDGKGRLWRTDRDGNGVFDKEQQVTVHADGERVEVNKTYNAIGTVISTSTTTTSSDGLTVTMVRDDTTETIIYSPTNTDSYTWSYDLTLTDGTYEVTSEHKVGNDGTEIWTYTKVYSTWQQGTTYTPDATDPFIVDTRTNSQIKTENGWTQWLVTEVTETRLDAVTKQRLYDEVEKLYDTLLDRGLSSSEYEKLIGYVVDDALDLDTLAKELREGDEFVIRYGTLSDVDYINQLYMNTFDRAPTMEEFASDLASLKGQADPWSGVVDALDRDGLAARLALSAEHELAGNVQRFTDNYDAVEPADGSGGGTQVPSDFERYHDKGQVEAQVKGVFHALYDREPTSSELHSTVTAYLAADAELDWVVTHLISQNLDASSPNNIGALTGSALVTQAYVNAFGRPPIQQEHDAFVAMLANGTLTKAQFVAALGENASTVTIVGTEGNDTLVGLLGRDVINGGNGDDVLIGGAGGDRLDGGLGFDTASYSNATAGVYVHMGHIAQNAGDAAGDSYQSIEALEGSSHDDTLIGDALRFVGGDGDDLVTGYNTAGIVIEGGAGNDRLFGDEGSDIIDFGTGDDIANAWTGADTFIFKVGYGQDTIIDFEGGFGAGDVIQLESSLVTDYTSLLSQMNEVGSNTIIDFGNGDAIKLLNTSVTDLHADDFSLIGGAALANSAPTAIEDSGFSTGIDVAVTIAATALLTNDGDVDGDTLTIQSVQGAVNGSVALDANGDVVFTPTVGFSGAASFTYTVNDGNGGTSTAQVDLSVGVPATIVLEKRISTSGDDVEEDASGAVYTDSSDLELVDDIGWSGPDQTVGLRFTSLDIPQGAVITNAWIQFQVDEVDSGAVSLEIRGQNADDAGAFTTAANNVSSRPTTASSVAWQPSDWTVVGEAGTAQRTPDLKALVQEIVDRQGWASLNDMAFIITGNGQRTAESYDGSTTGAPLFHVEYYVPPAASSTPTAGNDVLSGSLNADTIDGLAGDDVIDGLSGNDVLKGGDGTDILIGGAGADSLDGGNGADTASYRTATSAVTINLNDMSLNTGDALGDTYTSIEAIEGSDFNDTIIGDRTVDGGAGNDTLHATSLTGQTMVGGIGNDVIHANEGADNIDAGSGNDTVTAYGGDDIISLGDGDDYADAGSGNDTIYGGSGADEIRAGAGNDILFGGSGNDSLHGDDGNDQITLGDGDDYSAAGSGNDTIDGGAGADEIRAGAGDDTLLGGAGNDSLHGDDGHDLIDFGLGTDYATGGIGNDTFIFKAGYGNDEIGDFEGGSGVGDIIRLESGLVTDFATLLTYMSNQGTGHTFIDFGNGDILKLTNTTIASLDADDFGFLDGSPLANSAPVAGADNGFSTDVDVAVTITATALLTNDTDVDGDTVVIQSVQSAQNGSVAMDINGDVVFTPTAGYSGAASFTYTVSDGNGGTSTAQIDLNVGTTPPPPTHVGTSGNDTIYGTSGADIIDGLAGNDSLYGETGDDIVRGGDGDDYLDGWSGADTLEGGNGNDELWGYSGNDTLIGGAGDDTLRGEDGDDVIDFGAGDDYANGDAGNDTFIFRTGYGYDAIGGFEGGAGLGDVVEIDSALASDYTALQNLMTEWGGLHTYIDFGGGDSIVFWDTPNASLHADDFRFAA